MGLIKYGPLAAEVSGSVGGVTFARAYTGKTCRTWRAPTNKRRVNQLTQRYNHTRSSQRWFNVLTADQREGWDAYAAPIQFTNPLGEIYYLNGFNFYVRNNNISRAYRGTDLTAAPTQSGMPGIPLVTFSATASTGLIEIGTIEPDIDDTAEILTAVHWPRPISQKFPRRQPYDRHDYIGSEALPHTIANFGPLPESFELNYQVLITWYLFDEYQRISDLQISTIPFPAEP